ncbi:hypothetical protein ACIO3O_22910 [Streptomyces sp. NPDC087440]|uniref:hypothetical protein n=1 Tax=Streptomyces sp. NPDC087440 TaxID=3365790 RepID=UPI00381EC7B2
MDEVTVVRRAPETSRRSGGRRAALASAVCLAAAVALAGPAPAAHADPEDLICDGAWHFDLEGKPERIRQEVMSFTLDNRSDPDHPLDRTETISQGSAKSFSNSFSKEYSVEASASAGFGAFSASISASYGSSSTQEMQESVSIEKGTEFPMSVGPGKGVV